MDSEKRVAPDGPAYPPVQGEMQPGPAYTASYSQPGPAYAPPPTGYAPPQSGYAPPPQQMMYQPGQSQMQTTYPVIIHTAPRPPTPPMSPGYKRAFVGLGAIQTAIGLFSILINIVGQAMSLEAFYVGAGYWCGIMFILTGAFGVVSGKKEHKGFVITFLVLSILAPLTWSWGIIGQSSAGLVNGTWNYNCGYYNYHSSTYIKCSRNSTLAMNSLLLIGGVAELISAIVSAAFCCGALCCRTRATPGQVQYVAAGHQQVIMAGSQQVQYQPMAGIQPVASMQPAGVVSPADINPQYQAAGGVQVQQPGVQPAPGASGPVPDAPPAYSEFDSPTKM